MSLEEIKKRKLEELNRQLENQKQEEEYLQQQIQQIEAVVKQRMTKDALQRFGNIKIAHPEKAIQALVILAQTIQRGKLDKVDDETLKEVLKVITPKKPQMRINKK